MISNITNQGKSEFGNLVIHDFYRVRKFPCDYLRTIIDIGSNIGFFCNMMRYLHPNALIIGLEPCIETFGYLKQNTNMLNINIENKAFGNGETFYFKNRNNHLLSNIFDKENPDSGYGIESVGLSWIINKYKIHSGDRLFLKFDCEGGEKYLVNNDYSENIIRKSVQTLLEVHFQSKDTPYDYWLKWEDYDSWIRDSFSNTHDIEYYKSSKDKGYGHYCLVNKEYK